MTREHVVVLSILVDGDNNNGSKPWWETLGLPAPEYWDERFGEHVLVRVVFDKEVRRTP